MRWRRHTAAALVLILASAATAAPDTEAVLAAIPEAAFDKQVLVIGETHSRPASHALTLGLIRRALDADRCVTFALELPSDQTIVWRSLGSAADKRPVAIHSIHDSPSLRTVLRQTAALARDTCLRLSAIDRTRGARIHHPGGRDFLMAQRLAKLAGEDRLVIALLGSNHAPRRIDWDFDEPGQSTTYYLTERGIESFVIMQNWVEIDEPRVLRQDTARNIAAYNALQWHRSVMPAQSLSRYADRLILWPDRGRSEFDTLD